GTFQVLPTGQGAATAAVALAGDNCTALYVNQDDLIRRFDVCANAPLTNFGAAVPGTSICLDVRVRSNGDVLVACAGEIVRWNASGDVIQTYSNPGATFYNLSLDPDGQTFWTV